MPDHDTFRMIRPGERLAGLPSRPWNAMIAHLRGAPPPMGLGDRAPTEGIVPVRNDSGNDVDRFGVLGMDGVIVTQDDNEDEFYNRPTLTGVTPGLAHPGRFIILQEPAADGEIVRGMIAGVTPVLINVVDEGDRYADVEDDPDYAGVRLKSALSGVARILWKESGTAEKWAYLQFPVAGPTLLGGKVVSGGVRNTSNAAWQSFILAGEAFISHLVVHACDPDGSNVRTGRDCYVKAQADPGTAPSGYERIAEDDVILWTPTGQGLDAVPGTNPVLYFDGYLLAVAGASGAQLTFRVVD